jgi:hypothetical protein
MLWANNQQNELLQQRLQLNLLQKCQQKHQLNQLQKFLPKLLQNDLQKLELQQMNL